MLFNLFRKKKEEPAKSSLLFADINQSPLQAGDLVESLRYDLGKCRIVKLEKGYEYESLENGRRVNWVRMVDAITQLQKVKKITE
jgi:hypothetical protein